ncbi:hypothetical protein [Idiomarina sp. UBA1919]|uniref:hypothetical protein n=1 Tax=Idiomarina sp. UBA1919 TaxID=1946640 RepID=UPI0025811322|nr:hypothetical protein [Idiomarina sp. UBA1919]
MLNDYMFSPEPWGALYKILPVMVLIGYLATRVFPYSAVLSLLCKVSSLLVFLQCFRLANTYSGGEYAIVISILAFSGVAIWFVDSIKGREIFQIDSEYYWNKKRKNKVRYHK